MRLSTSKTDIKLRGREFTTKDISVINKLVKKHYSKGRTFISLEVCKKMDWKQPNGWLKDRACREVLKLLDQDGIINLPISKIKKKSTPSTKAANKHDVLNGNLAEKGLNNLSFNKIKFLQVKGSKQELLWNEVVNTYHYLGFKTFVGRSLKYLIYYEEKIIAALGFCDPAWKLEARDIIFKAEGMTESEIRWRGINNGRFLILPWINVKNLASFLLGKIVKLVQNDWYNYYKVRPLYLETFVHSKKFEGTCYKASNWQEVGITKGYKKIGWTHYNSQVPKKIFLYYLNKKR